jgi:hypothetical protein
MVILTDKQVHLLLSTELLQMAVDLVEAEVKVVELEVTAAQAEAEQEEGAVALTKVTLVD